TLNTDIDWSSVDFNGKTGVTKTNMWQNTVWNNHYVLVKNVESVAFLIADSGISDSSRIKVKGASSTLKAENSNPSTFLGVPNLTRNNITKISFQNTFPVCANPTDVSVDGKAGVIACVNNSTEIVIGANEGVLANANSAYLFANLSVNSGVDIDLDNFNNAVLDNMSFMFQNSKIKSIINYPSNFGSTASNMQSMFEETTFPDEFILPVRFGNRVTNTTNMFTGAILTGNIDWSFTDFDNHPATITTSMFNNTSWNNYFILVQDIGDLTFLTTNTGASLSNIQIKSHSSVLKAETVNPTNFLNMPNLTRAQITKLTFQKTLPICSNPTDVSVDGKNGVLACVTGTEITIGSNGGVVANANSQYLFANLTNSNGVDFDLTHLYTYLTTDISAMFQSTIIKSTPNWSDAFADLATNMTNLFQNASLPDGFSLPQSFGLAADNMSNAFQGATLKGNINWSNSDFSDKSGVNVTNMFKNTTWNNYYLWVANQDSLVFLTNNTSALAYININIKGTVLKAEVANPVTFLNLASPTRDAITKITWQTTLPTCSNPTDLSADEAGGILACVVASKQVIIGSKNGVLANINSSNLFANLKVNDGVSIDFSGLNTVAVTDMTNMFQNTWLKSMANWPQGFGSQTINMSSMFNNAKLFYGFTLPDGFGSKALDMSSMFKNCILPARFVFPSIFGSKAINMSSMFEQSYFPLNFAFLDTFGNSATNMSSMFRGAGITNYVDWGDNYSFKDHPEANKTDMFTDTRWSVNGGVIWVADSVAEAFLTNNTGATVDNIKTRNLSHTLKTAGFNDQLFLGIPGSDKKDIHQIFFQNKFPTVCSTLTDVSADDSRGVLGCFNNGNIIIGAPGGVVANYNSSNLFARLSYSYGVNIYLDNFVASGIQIMDHMFAGDSGDKNLTTINVVTNIPLNFGTAPQTSAPYMFSYAVLEGFEFPHDFGSFISNARNMFANCSLPNGFTVPSKLTITQDMRSMFSGASLPAGFNIPHDFGSLALDTSNMFDNAKLNGDIDWSYVDFSGKSSVTKTDMFKDTVWNNHFILVKNIGSVNFFITDSGISDNSRIKIKGTNNTLKAEVVNPSTFFNLSSPTRAQITKVSFQNTFPLCDNPTDVSADGKGGVIVCVVNNTEIVIGGSGKTVANTNSSNLLANLSVNDGVDIDLTNLDTATVTDMSNMFAASKLKSTPVWSDNFAKVSPNMAYMFSGTLLPNNFSLPNDFGRAVTNMAYMWQNCIFPVGFVLPDGFGQAAISMIHMFEGTTFSTDFTLSSNFGFAAGDMSYMFSKATLKANLDWTKTNFDSRLEAGVAKTAMFDGVVWNNYYIKAVNLESRDFLTDGTEAVADINIKAGDIVTLKAEGSDPSLFLGIPGSYRYAISKIIWQNALPTCSSPVDVSSDGGGKIIGCVINDTEIVIGSNGDIVANADSSNLFANLTKSTGVDINFKNLYVNDINKMISMFKKSKIQSITNLSNHFGVKTDDMSDMFFSAALPANFSLPAKFGSAAKNMSGMFRKTSLPTNFSLPDGFGSQANNMSYMFLYIDLSNLNNFSLPDNFGSQATNIADMFFGSNLPANFVLPANFASATQDMSDLFANAILSGNIDWSGTDFSGKTGVNKSDMFSDVNWNNYYILAKNTESVKFLITDSGISDTSRVKVK
ncbi:MAG: DUF285 domain-containing protein, partial [Bifidobacteriaceae bacterium]|nr:DUF285 domain-containing protein [Bifidobacteriaceae bacterium]